MLKEPNLVNLFFFCPNLTLVGRAKSHSKKWVLALVIGSRKY